MIFCNVTAIQFLQKADCLAELVWEIAIMLHGKYRVVMLLALL